MNNKQVFKKKQYQFFRRSFAIDPGTAHTVIWSPHKGVVLQEPSVLAMDTRYQSVYTAGQRAYQMIGKAPKNIEVIKPIQAGAINHFNHTVKMLNAFFNRITHRSPVIKTRLIITIPFGTTQVERQAVIAAGKRLGTKEIILIEAPLAAAMGAGLPVNEPTGVFIVNLGAGTTEVAVLSLGGIVQAASLRQGGETLDECIQRYIFKKYRVEIGLNAATRAKEEAGYATDPPEEEYELKGFNWKIRRPDRFSVPVSELTEAMDPVLSSLCSSVRKIFELTPPQLASDIIRNGIYITGGGSLLHHMGQLLSEKLQLPVKRVKEPFTGAAKGASKALQYMKDRSLDLYRA